MLPYPGCNRGLVLCVLIVILQLVILNYVNAQKPEHVHAGVLRIKVSEGMARQLEKSSLKKNSDNVLTTGIEKLDGVSRKFKVSSMKRVFPHAGKYEAKHRKYGLHRWYEVEIEKSIPIRQAIPGFKSITELEVVEPVYKKQIVGSSNPGFGSVPIKTAVGGTLPGGTNDPMLSNQWHYHNTGQTGGSAGADISLFDAWAIETGSSNVIIAIEDGGIDLTHPDLAANLWVNSDEIPNNGVDDDANGYVDDYNGYSFVDHTGNILAHDHGTHVAGTVAAVNNNGVGVAGVAGGSGNGDGVRLMSCAVFSYWGGADGFAQAFVYSADNGAVISQNSWSYTFPDYVEQAILDGIDYFIAEAGKDEGGNQNGPMNGGIVIFAAANNNSNANYWPAVYGPVLSVAATNHLDAKAWYSNYGTWVDIAAPGGETNVYEQGVLSTLPSNQYGYYQGTSMACPHVSGVAGLVVSQMAGVGLTPALLRDRLLQTTDNIDASNPSYLGQLGTGRLNAANALVNEDDGLPPLSITDLTATSSSLHSVTLTWTAPADGNRPAAVYDLRISNEPITEANFYSAGSISGVPAPKVPGGSESFTVVGLDAGTLYYFAINSADLHGNVSAISNVIEVTTTPPPVIEISPLQLSADLVTAGSDTLMFTISNSGLSELVYSITDNDSLGRVIVGVSAGNILPSNSANIDVVVNASGLLAGQYSYNLMISSNDPLSPEVVVPILVNVSNNGVPIASISTSNLSFGTVMIGRTKTLGVLVKNEGSETLELQSASTDHQFFGTDLDGPASIAAFESRIINVSFIPADTGTVAANLTISTNDPQNTQFIVQLGARGVEPPSLILEPSQIDFVAYKDHIEDKFLKLTNAGGSLLSFRLEEDATTDSTSAFESDLVISPSTDASPGANVFQVSSGAFANANTVKIKANGLSQKPVRVLIVSPDPNTNDLYTILSAYPDLEVNWNEARWVEAWTLTYYDVVILTNNIPWSGNDADPEKIGDLLADYIDIGGKVIVHQMAHSSLPDYQLKGRFITDNYSPFTMATSSSWGFANMGAIREPAHPVLNGVSFLQYNGYIGNVGVTPGSTLLANWDNGSVFLAANENVLGVNLLPSSGYGGPMDWTGDLPLLLHNTINHFAAPEPTFLTLDFKGGTVQPYTSIDFVKIRLQASELDPGNYNTSLKLYTNDPNNSVVEIPVTMTIYGEQFSTSPDSLVADLYRGETKNEVVSITHNGTQSHLYEITVEPYGVQSVAALAKSQGFDTKKNQAPAINPQVLREFARKLSSGEQTKLSTSDLKALSLPPLPAVLNTVYATDFEDFVLGDGMQNGWYTYNGWVVDSTNAFSGSKHLHQQINDSIDFSLAGSPFIGDGPSMFSSVSLRLNLQGTGGDFQIIPLSSNGEMQSTTVMFSSSGIAVYEKVEEWAQIRWLDIPRPVGYFDLTIESNEITGEFSLYFDGQEVFHGNGFKGNAANVLLLTSLQYGSNLSIDVDDLRLYDGKKFNRLPSFLEISPMSGTISPQETVNFDVLLKTDSLQAGTYVADINFFADQDAVAIPVILNYAGSQLSLNPSMLHLEVSADQTATATFSILNQGQGDVPINVTAVSTGVTSSSELAAAAPASVLTRFAEFLSTRTLDEKGFRLPVFMKDVALITPLANLYGTSFEDFAQGPLGQKGWAGNENCFIDLINPSHATSHARLNSQTNGWTYAISPTIAPGSAEKSSISMDLDINGPVNFININLNSLTKFVADVTFNNGEIYVSTYLGNDAFQTIKINEEIPDSYFKLAVEIDKSTSQFNLLINEKVVFTGQAGDSYISTTYYSIGGETGGTVDLDNFQLFDGGLSDFPEFLSFSPDSGIVPSEGSLDILVNITAPSNAGRYQANILVKDGTEQKILPLTLVVVKPELRVSPNSLYQEQPIGQLANQHLLVENIGDSFVNYEIRVNENGINAALSAMGNNKPRTALSHQPSSSRPFKEVTRQLLSDKNLKIDAAVFSLGKIETTSDSLATLYATSFEEFDLGHAGQLGWTVYGAPWVVTDSLPHTGEKHMSLHLEPGAEYQGNAITPYVASGVSDFVTSSTKVNLHGDDLALWIIAHSSYGPSVMLHHSNGSVYVYSNQGFQLTQIKFPEGYFDLTFQINRQSFKLGIYINQELVFSGFALNNNINMMEYVAFNEMNADGYFDIDDVQIKDGQALPSPFLTVNPPAGTLNPSNSTYHTATFDSHGLTQGTYFADIDFMVNGATVVTVPATFHVLGLPEIQVTPNSQVVDVDYHGQASRTMVISNPGGQTLYFNLGIEEPQGIATANNPVAKTSRDDASVLAKQEEDKKLSTKATLNPQPVTIVVGKTLGGEQFENGVPPSQWTVINNTANGPQWNTASSYGEGNYSYSGEAATVSSDAFGSAPLNTELISPQYDIQGYRDVTIQYYANYQNYGNRDFLDLDIRVDGGEWKTVLKWNEDHGQFRSYGEFVSINLDYLLNNASSFQLRWHYYDSNPGAHDWYAQVDNVSITAQSLPWLTLSHSWGWVEPGSELNVNLFMDGSMLPAGTFDKLIKVYSNAANAAIVDVPVSLTIRTAPQLIFEPDTITERLYVNTSSQQQAVMSNTGESALNYSFAGQFLPSIVKNTVSRIYPQNYVVEKSVKDTRIGHPVLTGQGGPDEGGYVWVDSNEPGGPVFNWQDIRYSGNQLYLNDDDAALVSLPFTFPFYENVYDQLKISSNGYVTFGEVGNSLSNSELPNSYEPNNIIAAFWDDLIPWYGGMVTYQSFEDKFIIQYSDVPYFYETSSPNTFQIILQRDGDIVLQYLAINNSFSSTTGIENSTGSTGLQVAFNTNYITNNLAVLFSNKTSKWLSVNPASGIIAGNSSTNIGLDFSSGALAAGKYTANLLISSNDGDEPMKQVPVELTVFDNYAPVIDSISDISVIETETASLTITGHDEDDPQVTLSIINKPAFITLTSTGNGTTTYAIKPLISHHGDYLLTVEAVDSRGLTSYRNFQLHVAPYGVENFSLIDKRNGQVILNFATSVTLNRADAAYPYYQIRANTNPGVVGSVQFLMNGKNAKGSATAPYLLADAELRNLKVGNHTLKATAYTQKSNKGQAGASVQATIAVVNQAVSPGNATPTLTISPNPVENELRVKLTGEVSGESELVIVDGRGYAVYRLKVTYEQMQDLRIDLSSLRSGIYYVQLTDSLGQRVTTRMVKK